MSLAHLSAFSCWGHTGYRLWQTYTVLAVLSHGHALAPRQKPPRLWGPPMPCFVSKNQPDTLAMVEQAATP